LEKVIPQIRYEAIQFPNRTIQALNGWNIIDVTWEELIWSAVTCGYWNYHQLFQFRNFSAFDLTIRVLRVMSNLEIDHTNNLGKTTLYSNMDKTEKGYISYFIGMMVNKVLISRLFGTPWLVHLVTLERMNYVFNFHGGSRPDLVGFHPRFGFLITEAKGRSNGYSNIALIRGKNQTRSVRRVNGQYPFMRVATESYFAPYLEARIIDPPTFRKNAIDLKIEPKDFIEAYYGNIQDHIENLYNKIIFKKMGIDIDISRINKTKQYLEKILIKGNNEKFFKYESNIESKYKFNDGINLNIDTEVFKKIIGE
tara:strand:- start:54812 stop:55741 length:930 start_codon:yes stop_codon:yes gene_type:complete